MRDFGHLAEHDRGRAVFFGRQVHRLFDALGVERLAGDGEMDVDFGEDLGGRYRRAWRGDRDGLCDRRLFLLTNCRLFRDSFHDGGNVVRRGSEYSIQAVSHFPASISG